MPRLVWLAVDAVGTIHGPFGGFGEIRLAPEAPRPVVLLQVTDDADGPQFLIAGDAMADAMHALIFQDRSEKQAAFNRRVNWAVESSERSSSG